MQPYKIKANCLILGPYAFNTLTKMTTYMSLSYMYLFNTFWIISNSSLLNILRSRSSGSFSTSSLQTLRLCSRFFFQFIIFSNQLLKFSVFIAMLNFFVIFKLNLLIIFRFFAPDSLLMWRLITHPPPPSTANNPIKWGRCWEWGTGRIRF